MNIQSSSRYCWALATARLLIGMLHHLCLGIAQKCCAVQSPGAAPKGHHQTLIPSQQIGVAGRNGLQLDTSGAAVEQELLWPPYLHSWLNSCLRDCSSTYWLAKVQVFLLREGPSN